MNYFFKKIKLASTLTSREAYQKWAATYPPIAHNRFMKIEQATLSAMLPELTGLRVLDVACGSGRWSNIARERGAAVVWGVDDSRAMLRASEQSFIAQADMTELPLPPNYFDVAICGLAIGHVVTPRMWATLHEMQRVLVDGGIMVVSDVHPTRMWHGGKRTFQDGRTTYAIEHYIHSYADYHKAAKTLGLTIDDVQEVYDEPETPPVLLAFKFIK